MACHLGEVDIATFEVFTQPPKDLRTKIQELQPVGILQFHYFIEVPILCSKWNDSVGEERKLVSYDGIYTGPGALCIDTGIHLPSIWLHFIMDVLSNLDMIRL